MMATKNSVTWRRMGLVLKIPKQHHWWKSHAAPPTCLPLSDRCWRIWFAGRDAKGRAGIISADVDPNNSMKILALRDSQILERGPDGSFDSAGMWPATALRIDGRILLWYTGMRLGKSVPYQLAIGLAVSNDNGISFEKVKEEPVLSAGSNESKFVTTPAVVRRSKRFMMWYSACPGWKSINGQLESFYDLHYAYSADGIDWTPSDKPVLSFDQVQWAGMGRPWISLAGKPTLWFGARGSKDFRKSSSDAYRLYSAPLHGTTINADEVEPVLFTPTPEDEGWDSWMQSYCCVVPWGSTRIMFYCGNDFGRNGFGYAIEECYI
jgi:hypothetical protein